MRLQQPIWPRFLPTHVVLNLARLGPIGPKLPAPGTWGSVAGLLYFTVFFYPLGAVATVLLSTLACYLAVALCGEAEFRLGRKDPGEVILDEFVVMPLCFLGWRMLALARRRGSLAEVGGHSDRFCAVSLLRHFAAAWHPPAAGLARRLGCGGG